MGSRGAFVNIDDNNYNFVDGGQLYKTIYFDKENDIKILKQSKGSIKVPDYSHTGDVIYAVFQKGKVKSIGIYKKHIKIASIDLFHSHTNKDGTMFENHVHLDLSHKEDVRDLTEEEKDLVKYVESLGKKINRS